MRILDRDDGIGHIFRNFGRNQKHGPGQITRYAFFQLTQHFHLMISLSFAMMFAKGHQQVLLLIVFGDEIEKQNRRILTLRVEFYELGCVDDLCAVTLPALSFDTANSAVEMARAIIAMALISLQSGFCAGNTMQGAKRSVRATTLDAISCAFILTLLVIAHIRWTLHPILSPQPEHRINADASARRCS